MNELTRTNALLYKTDTGFEICTYYKNMYIDFLNDQVFVRKTDKQISNLFFTKKAMSAKQITYIISVLRKERTLRLLSKFRRNRDTDYLLGLSQSTKNDLIRHCKLSDSNPFIVSFLTFKHDETEPILIRLNKPSSTTNFYKRINLEDQLESEKIKIDSFHGNDPYKLDFYNSVTKLLDQLKFYSSKEVQKCVHIKGSITNAWMKCWEMIHTFQLLKDKSSFFCNAEFPGAFILALNHYIQTRDKKKYKWYANSLLPDGRKETLKDSFDLYKKYPKNWLMNAEHNGDVTDPHMVKYIESKIQKVDLYTSDISTGAETNEEEKEAKFNLGQVICGLKTLKNGGTLVCRMIMFFKPFSMSLLQILSQLFDELYVTKPMASRPANSEIYVVGKGYTNNPELVDLLMEKLEQWTPDMHIQIEPIKEDFYLQAVYALHYVYERQISFLQKNMNCVQTMYDKIKGKDLKQVNVYTIGKTCSNEDFEYRKLLVEYWKDQFKVDFLPKECDL